MHLTHEPMSPVFDKWHIAGAPFAAVLHRFTAPDHSDPHDHPWPFQSTVLHGSYVEQVYQLDGSSELIARKRGDAFFVPAQHIHRIVDLPDGECWTIIIPGPHEQDSGVYQFRDGQAFYRPWHRDEFERVSP